MNLMCPSGPPTRRVSLSGQETCQARNAVHIPFKMKVIQYALDNFTDEYENRDKTINVPRLYNETVYTRFGL